MWSSVAAFAVFAAVLTVTPGLDTMLVLRTTAMAGRRAGFGTVVGVCTGCLVWAVASALGVTAVVATSRLAFEVLRAAGVTYLCWLGVRALWPTARGATKSRRTAAAGGELEPGGRSGFGPGLVTNLLNPKVGVFYLAVMPQFLPSGLHPLAGSLTLGVVHVVEGLAWLSVVVLAADRMRGALTRPRVKRRLEQVAGVAFLGFGLRLALERAPGQ